MQYAIIIQYINILQYVNIKRTYCTATLQLKSRYLSKLDFTLQISQANEKVKYKPCIYTIVIFNLYLSNLVQAAVITRPVAFASKYRQI